MVAVPAGRGTPKFTNVNLCSKGSDLALACHCRRGPFNGMFGYSFALSLHAHRHFISQVLVILNLNGKFSFAPIHQTRVLIELYSGETISVSQLRTSLFTSSGEGEGLGCRFLIAPSTTQIAQTPGMITVTIAATRLHRSLTNVYSSDM